MLTYSVFGVDICSTVDEMLSTLAVSRPHGHVERSAVQLQGEEQFRYLIDVKKGKTLNLPWV